MCLARKNIFIAFFSANTMTRFWIPHIVCLNSSNARCMAKSFFAYLVNSIRLVLNPLEQKATCTNLLVSHVFLFVNSSFTKTSTAACLLASHMITNCCSGRRNFSDSLDDFNRHSLFSKFVSLFCCVGLKQISILNIQCNGATLSRVGM